MKHIYRIYIERMAEYMKAHGVIFTLSEIKETARYLYKVDEELRTFRYGWN